MGNLCFFLFLLFPLLLPSKWKGSGIWQHICNKKVHFTSKNSHTQSYSVSHVRGSITRHISIQQFSEKTRKNQINFICGRFNHSTAPALRCFFLNSFLLFCSEILLITVYKTSRLVCCINCHGYLHFGSYFWKHLRHFC